MWAFIIRFFTDETFFLGCARGGLLLLGGLAVAGELPGDTPKWLGALAMAAAGMIRSSSATAGPPASSVAKVGLLLPLLVAFGCAAQITGDGAQWSFGQAQATTCDSQSTTEKRDAGEGCSTASGGAVSEQAATLLAPVGAVLGAILKLIGLGAAA